MSATQRGGYRRSLDELADTSTIDELARTEFPRDFFDGAEAIDRRRFLALMGASLALAGTSGCARPPAEKIVPYVRQPEEIIPGQPLFFATAMTLGGVATGLLVESHEGRPTKVEGNPDHPASRGATDVFAQASVLGLYDPERAQAVTHLGWIRSWDEALATTREALAKQRDKRGAGLRILIETVTSPTLGRQLQELLQEWPAAKWHQYEPLARDHALAGARHAFGEPVNTHYRFDRADVVLSLDADFLSSGPGHLRYVRDFMARRRVRAGRLAMNRLYVVECTPTNTGAAADHRLPLRASDIESVARQVAAELGVNAGKSAGRFSDSQVQWVAAAARDLQKHRGTSIVIPGAPQPPVVHALAHAMNQALGNTEKTVIHTQPLEARPADSIVSLHELIDDMDRGSVDMLLILGGNPAYYCPADVQFKERLKDLAKRNGSLCIHLGLYQDETSQWCHWHIPEAHYLEAWGDARAYDGTVSIQQPLIAPLYGGKSAHELLAALSAQPERSGYEIVRDYWREHWKSQGAAGDFESSWRRALHDGLIAGTAFRPKSVTLQPNWARAAAPPAKPEGLEIVFQPDPTIYDGRFANNGWLQELPKPLTRLTWDNAALMSLATAKQLGLSYSPATSVHGGEHGAVVADVIKLQYQGREVTAPIWIMPGHADGAITVQLGFGRTHAGKIGSNTGFNAYQLRTAAAPWFATGLRVAKTGESHQLACTQYHHNMENRDLIRSTTLREYPTFAAAMRKDHAEANRGRVPLTLYRPEEFPYEGYKWGMAIDLSACTGCGACVVACQAENNIPVVGKDQVARGREMHWLRIDRYYQGDPEKPEALATHFQPVPCMQCEDAPCEVVCPVGATAHSHEGLNDMVYNRCVGTRYCSNNCPYKVRRFNFLQYADYATQSQKLLHNPNVTVRSRGVMEKCTYCVQRINRARIEAEKEDRRIRDGEILTACQAACPAEAIVFGDLNHSSSRVAKLKTEPTSYALLAEVNARPRTTYLASVRNPNPEIS